MQAYFSPAVVSLHIDLVELSLTLAQVVWHAIVHHGEHGQRIGELYEYAHVPTKYPPSAHVTSISHYATCDATKSRDEMEP